MPREGTGVRRWIFRVACLLLRSRSKDAVAKFLLTATKTCQKDRAKEIQEAIEGAGRGVVGRHRQWPDRDDALVKKVLATGFSQASLIARSPCSVGTDVSSLWRLLCHLFPDDPLLCIGASQCVFDTVRLSEWQRYLFSSRPQFIVPNPMTQRLGRTQDGKLSARSNNNTGPRRFLVVEFDFKPGTIKSDKALLEFGIQFGLRNTLDLCACLLNELAKRAPLALVVWSGGKSLHGWFPVGGADPRGVEAFFQYACNLGADRQTWTPSQFVRLPLGCRDTGVIQSVVFFNPNIPVI